LAKNPDSIPLLPAVIILSYNYILRMIYALKLLLSSNKSDASML